MDGTLIEAWASMKRFRPKDGSGAPPIGGRNGERDFHWRLRHDHARTPPWSRNFGSRRLRGVQKRAINRGILFRRSRNLARFAADFRALLELVVAIAGRREAFTFFPMTSPLGRCAGASGATPISTPPTLSSCNQARPTKGNVLTVLMSPFCERLRRHEAISDFCAKTRRRMRRCAH